MESQFDPHLLLLLDGKGSKLFRASILAAADVAGVFLLCAKQWMLLRCFTAALLLLLPFRRIRQRFLGARYWRRRWDGRRGSLSLSVLPVCTHTSAHVSGDGLCKQGSDQKRRWKGTQSTRLAGILSRNNGKEGRGKIQRFENRHWLI